MLGGLITLNHNGKAEMIKWGAWMVGIKKAMAI